MVIVVQLHETPLPALLRLSLEDRETLHKSEFSSEDYDQRKLHEAFGPIAPRASAAATRMIRLYLDVTASGDDAEDFAEILIDAFALLLFQRFVPVDPKFEDHRDFALSIALRERADGLRASLGNLRLAISR